MNTVNVYVENITETLVTYNTIRVYRANSPGGTYSLDGTVALVANQEQYTYSDADGDAFHTYRYTFYHSGTTAETSQAEVARNNGTRHRELRIAAAIRAGAGWESSCTALGSTTSLYDARLADQGVDSAFMSGVWLYRPDATDALDRVRRCTASPYNVANSFLQVSRNWNNAPAANEVYQGFALLPPVKGAGVAYSWDEAIEDALRNLWVTDQLNLGEGTTTGQTRFSVQNLGVDKEDIRAVYLRTADSNGILSDLDCRTNGYDWRVVENQLADLKVEIDPAPLTDETVIVEALRHFSPTYADTDVTNCPYDLAVRAVVYRAYRHLNRVQVGKYQAELQQARQDLNEIYRHPATVAVLA